MNPKEYTRLLTIKKTIDPDNEYIGQSPAILHMFAEIDLLNRRPDSPVLLLGPSGAGKSALGRLIHASSQRRVGKYADPSATAATGNNEQLVREQWVGYGEDSTVSGANKKGRSGIIDDCRGGTVFVDELHAAPSWFQTFLNDVIDRKPIIPPHGRPIPVQPDVRLICATYLPMQELRKSMNPDFLRRLDGCVLEVPPLNQRKEDIILLVNAWSSGCAPTPAFLLALLDFDWTGNVGQIKKVIETAVDRAQSATGKALSGSNLSTSIKFRLPHLPEIEPEWTSYFLTAPKLTLECLRLPEPGIPEAIRTLTTEEADERLLNYLVKILERQGLRKGRGLQERLAELLGTSPSTIHRRLKSRGHESNPAPH